MPEFLKCFDWWKFYDNSCEGSVSRYKHDKIVITYISSATPFSMFNISMPFDCLFTNGQFWDAFCVKLLQFSVEIVNFQLSSICLDFAIYKETENFKSGTFKIFYNFQLAFCCHLKSTAFIQHLQNFQNCHLVT